MIVRELRHPIADEDVMIRSGILDAINEFLSLFDQATTSSEKTEDELVLALDRLALASHFAKCKFDGRDFPDPPEKNYADLRAVVSKRFPNFGYYNLPDEVTTKINEAGIMIGDAIDDLTDIALDLQETKWRWINTSVDDALWQFKFSYDTHWGEHLRNLQVYLHALKSAV